MTRRKLYALTDDQAMLVMLMLKAHPAGTDVVAALLAPAATVEDGWSRTCPTCGTWVEPEDKP